MDKGQSQNFFLPLFLNKKKIILQFFRIKDSSVHETWWKDVECAMSFFTLAWYIVQLSTLYMVAMANQ